MNRSEHNRKVALSRWKKVRDREEKFIRKNSASNRYLKMRMLGYLAGDGYVSVRNEGKNYTIRFFPDHESLIKPFVEASQKLYGKSPGVKQLKNHYLLSLYSKTVVLDILEEGDLRSLVWRLPSFNNKKEKVEWLRAFFDSEASVVGTRISLGSVNESGVKQIQELLKEFNVEAKIYKYIQKNDNWNDVFFLIITKKASVKSYFNEIGFNHSLKAEKLKRVLSTK